MNDKSNRFDEATDLILLYSGLNKDLDLRAMEVLRGLQEAKLDYQALYDFYNAKEPVE